MRRIILGSDGSPEAREAEQYALAMLQPGDDIIALHVVNTDLMHYGLIDQLATQADKENFLAYIRKQGEEECASRLGPFADAAAKSGAKVALHVRWGDPARELLSIASEHDAHEIVLAGSSWNTNWHEPHMEARLDRSSPCKITILP